MKRRACWALAEALESRCLLSQPVFLGPTYYPTGINPAAVVTADFDGDSKVDLAVANAGDNSISVLLNSGDGTFAAKVDYGIGQTPSSLTATDLNGDGKTDLAVVYENAFPNYSTTYVHTLLNSGNGTFVTGGDFYAGYGAPASATYVPPSSVTAADFNGDGKLDLAVGTSSEDSGAVNVLLNSGNGTFASSVSYDTFPNPASVMASDFNGDNRPDLAVLDPSYNGSGVRVFLNNGDGSFVATADYLISSQPRSMAIADFNGDGKPDLAVSTDGLVTLLFNNRNGSFAPGINYRTSAYYGGGGVHYTRMVAADFNGDGKVDIAAASLPGSNATSFTLILNNGNGTFASPIEYPGPNPYAVMAAADFNGDGRTDLAWVNTFYYAYPTGVGVLLNAGDSLFAARRDYLDAQTRPDKTFAVDFNGDGKLDLILGSSFSPVLFLNNGDGTFIKAGYLGVEKALAVADLNGDGKPDLVVSRGRLFSDYNDWILGVRLNNGDGAFAPTTDYLPPARPYTSNFYSAAADFNGDGKLDLAASPSGGTSVTIFLNNGDGTFAAGVDYAGSGNMTVADFNGDGKLDVAVSAATELRLLLNNGDGTFSVGESYPALRGSVASADFNNDGTPDIALNNDSGLFLFLNNGAGSFTMVVLSLYPGPPLSSYIVAADFNGDGKVDLASMGRLLLNTGGGTFARPLGFAVGPGARDGAISSADFNGDGKPDLSWPNLYDNSFSVMLNVTPTVVQSAAFDYDGPQQTIHFQFFGDVSAGLSASSLSVKSVPGNAPVSILGYSYDRATNTATFLLPTPLPDGNYRAILHAAGLPGDYSFDFFILRGDANHDRVVNANDLRILAMNWGRTGTWSQGDFNYDGIVNVRDLIIFALNWQNRVDPPPAPVPPTLAATRPPARTPTRVNSLLA